MSNVEDKFYGLWISNTDQQAIDECIAKGTWKRGNCPDPESEKNKIALMKKGERVFLYKGLKDVKISDTPFKSFLSADVYNLNKKIVKVQSLAIGRIISTNKESLSVTVDWDKEYKSNEWYIYFRQDGVWPFDDTQTPERKEEIYNIVFSHMEQDYKKWAENSYLQTKKYDKTFTRKQLIASRRNLFIEIANAHDLNYQKTKATYFQIYPNIPNEGSQGVHYEFIAEKEKLYLDLHIESKVNVKNRRDFREIIGELCIKYGYGINKKSWPLRIDISNLSDYEVKEAFNKIYKEFEPTIEKWYSKNGLIKNTMNNSLNATKMPLNQILYGPPGTGKTYKTVNKALKIIFEKEEDKTAIRHTFHKHSVNKSISDLKVILDIENPTDDERKDLKTVFDFYGNQIEFVAFHQSYGYEEFIEGIRADTNKQEEMIYVKNDGIFKAFCEKAKSIKTNKTSKYDFDDKVNIWKISLGDSQNSEEDYLFDYCIDNNKILLGFGNGLNFNNCNNRKEIADKLNDTEKYSYPPTAINTLKNKIQKGDIVLVSYGNKKLRAIAKIIGDYDFLENEELNNYIQSRSVEWLMVPEEPFTYEKILKKQLSQMSIYDIRSNVKIDELRYMLTQQDNEEEDKNYILIIDEINRGNISKIFGELITLIEDTKRIGAEEELRVKLPYSGDAGEPFGVPKNLYIIGTMNTADRSIAPIDTALRRRFVFEEMQPKSDKLKIKLDDADINLQNILKAINIRIEYLYDRDHTIGHTYLLDVDTLADLKFAFKNKILPLLAEYFYENWENIDLVLNENGFIVKDDTQHQYLSNITNKISNKNIYMTGNSDDWEVKHFQKIYDNAVNIDEQSTTADN